MAARLRAEERERLSGDWKRRESDLVLERDDQRRLAETRGNELERCRADLDTQTRAQAERAAARPPALPGTLAPPNSSSGASGPQVPPAGPSD